MEFFGPLSTAPTSSPTTVFQRNADDTRFPRFLLLLLGTGCCLPALPASSHRCSYPAKSSRLRAALRDRGGSHPPRGTAFALTLSVPYCGVSPGPRPGLVHASAPHCVRPRSLSGNVRCALRAPAPPRACGFPAVLLPSPRRASRADVLLRGCRQSHLRGLASCERATFRGGRHTGRGRPSVTRPFWSPRPATPPDPWRCGSASRSSVPARARGSPPPPLRPPARPRAARRPTSTPAPPAAAPPPHNGRRPPHRAHGSRPRARPSPTRRLPEARVLDYPLDSPPCAP